MNTTQIQIGEPTSKANLLLAALTTSETRTATHATEATQSPRPKRKPLLGLLVVAVALAAGDVGYHWWNYARTWTKTDTAFVAGHIYTVSTRFAGSVNHTPSLPDARPSSDRFRCGGRESKFLAVMNPTRPHSLILSRPGTPVLSRVFLPAFRSNPQTTHP